MSPLDIEEQETQIDMEAAEADISKDLFGENKDEDENLSGEPGSEPSAAEAAEAPPAQPTEAKSVEEKPKEGEGAAVEETSAEVQAVGAPKTWTKDELATWATVPKEVQEKLTPILARREEDFFRGISMYKSAAELGTRYDQVVEPYRAALAAENIDPVGLFQAFAANHYLLSRGTPEQKIELAANLMMGYGIPLEMVAEHIGSVGISQPDPEVLALRKEIAELRTGINSQFSTMRDQNLSAISSEIDKFADDGQHPYFDEVADDIAHFVEMGAPSLQDAYERAVYANPTTRQKEIDRLTGEALAGKKSEEAKRLDKRQRSMADHVKTTPTSRDGTVPVGSMDDTLDETFRSINERE